MPRVVLDPLCPPNLPSAQVQSEVWDASLRIAQDVRRFLLQVIDSNEILMLRTNNSNCPSTQERVNRTNSFTIEGDTIYFAIGLNRFTSPEAVGLEIFHFPASTNGRRLAEEIVDSTNSWRLQFSPAIPNRGVKRDEQERFPTIAETRPPAVALLPVFHSNPRERDIILNRDNQRSLAFFIAVGIADFFGIQRPSMDEPQPQPQPEPEPDNGTQPQPQPQPQPTGQGIGRFALPLIIGGAAAAVILPALLDQQDTTRS